MKKALITLLGSLSLVGFLTSCQDANNNSLIYYKPAPAIKKAELPIKNSLFVDDIIDNRVSDIHKFPSEQNADPLILVPFWPYSHSISTPIPRYTYLNMGTRRILTDLIFADIKAAGIFSDVSMPLFSLESQNTLQDSPHNIPSNSYVLVLTMNKAEWSRYMTSYGLSYPGTFLWILCAPISYGSINVEMKAELYKPGNLKVPIAEKTISKSIPCTEFIFDQVNYAPPKSEYKLARIFPSITAQLREFLVDSVIKAE
jgi:hypothetical protein